MRELHGHHGEHRRHGRHAGDAAHGRDATADAHIGRAPDAPARDSPDRAAQDALKLEMLTNPEARKAAFFKNQRNAEAVYAEYAARHAKSKPSDQPRIPGQRKPKEAQEHVPPESSDKPTGAIARHRQPSDRQEVKQSKPERSWLPRNDSAQAISGIAIFASSVAAAFNFLPDKWDAVAVSGFGAAVAGVAWANRRWKGKHGDRPED